MDVQEAHVGGMGVSSALIRDLDELAADHRASAGRWERVMVALAVLLLVAIGLETALVVFESAGPVPDGWTGLGALIIAACVVMTAGVILPLAERAAEDASGLARALEALSAAPGGERVDAAAALAERIGSRCAA